MNAHQRRVDARRMARALVALRSVAPVDVENEPCWCGVENPHYEDDGVAYGCSGSGEVDCDCGGDTCVCHNHGTLVCIGCENCEVDDDFVEFDGPYDDRIDEDA